MCEWDGLCKWKTTKSKKSREFESIMYNGSASIHCRRGWLRKRCSSCFEYEWWLSCFGCVPGLSWICFVDSAGNAFWTWNDERGRRFFSDSSFESYGNECAWDHLTSDPIWNRSKTKNAHRFPSSVFLEKFLPRRCFIGLIHLIVCFSIDVSVRRRSLFLIIALWCLSRTRCTNPHATDAHYKGDLTKGVVFRSSPVVLLAGGRPAFKSVEASWSDIEGKKPVSPEQSEVVQKERRKRILTGWLFFVDVEWWMIDACAAAKSKRRTIFFFLFSAFRLVFPLSQCYRLFTSFLSSLLSFSRFVINEKWEKSLRFVSNRTTGDDIYVQHSSSCV